ncbi:DNA primase [Oceanicoccus sagamiensis]|uniref:DNA primase n=1 Tax=Oceanicoccus sagamiensis TaxID=716816 RepID=A0A1X9N8A2_9GAMM|nr:DNA primase [Oceanicoccus sagamiensis]ARN74290.1 DNA primase [Oceanicoccus sagamiensis]
MAGRIPQSFIDDLLDRLDIVEVIDRRVSLKKSGRNFTACCPFHEEKTPSFSVNQEKQFYYCFGCGAGGNALGFIMDYERMDFPRAVEVLADTAGLEVPREASAFQEEPQQKKNIYTMLEKCADFYREQLKRNPQKQRAVDYLRGRGLSGEIARDFDIGYAPPGWDNLLKHLGLNQEDKQLLIDGGMLIEKEEDNKLYDRFRDRIIFPIRDNRGRIIAFGGRVLGDDKPKYLNSPETPVFHKSKELYGLYQSRKANRKLERLLIVEGYMDVVALAQHGVTWAAATLGTATSTEHLKRVFRQCPEVVFCFDGDEAGRKAAKRALESALPAMEDGRQARFLFLPQGEDPDSMVRSIGASDFIRMVDKAEPLEDYLFNSQAEGLELGSLDGRARLSTLAAPLIDQLPDGVFKALMMSSLAERTGLSQEKLTQILQRHQINKQPEPAPDKPEVVATREISPEPRQRAPRFNQQQDSTRDPILYAIALLLHEPKAASHVATPSALSRSEDNNAPLLAAMLELLHKRPDSTSAMLIGHWYGEAWGETLQQLLQLEQFIPGSDIELELKETLQHLERKYHQDQLGDQVDKLLTKDYAQLSDDEKQELKRLLSQKHDL